MNFDLWGSRVLKICSVYFYQSIYARTIIPAPSYGQILIFDHFFSNLTFLDPNDPLDDLRSKIPEHPEGSPAQGCLNPSFVEIGRNL